MTEARKRSASEPAEALLSHEHEAVVGEKRPITTSLGAVFVLFRALAGFFWIGVFALLWDELAKEAGLNPVEDRYVLWVIVAGGAVLALILIFLAIAVWLGNNVARVIVMLGLVISTTTAAVEYFVNGEEITIHTTLLTVALDILVLLALSSRSSRAWARQKMERKNKRHP